MPKNSKPSKRKISQKFFWLKNSLYCIIYSQIYIIFSHFHRKIEFFRCKKFSVEKFDRKIFLIIISLVHRIYEIYRSRKMIHPWKKLIEEIRNRNRTQKQFAVFVWKKNSEVNELIKWKRNITIQWDLILSEVFWTPEKYWINMQTDYDYEIAKKEREKQKMEQKQDFEVVTDIEKPETVEVQPSNEVESWNVYISRFYFVWRLYFYCFRLFNICHYFKILFLFHLLLFSLFFCYFVVIIGLHVDPIFFWSSKNLWQNQIPLNCDISFSFDQFIHLTIFLSYKNRELFLCSISVSYFFYQFFSWVYHFSTSVNFINSMN